MNRLRITGIIFMIIGITLLISDIIDPIITPFTHIFLMGSSEGKDIILFFIMGSMLILSPYINHGKNKNFYLSITIILTISTYLLIIMMEFLIRAKIGINPYTTFVTFNPATTTSITHSHLPKAALSPLTKLIAPTHIHTASSLTEYTPPFLLPWLLINLPLIYVLGLLSLGDRRDFHKIILIFAITTTIIGIIDGGLFSTPAMVGLSGMLGMRALKVPFSPRNLINPSIIIASLIILRIIIGLMLSTPEYYEVTLLQPRENIDLENFKVLSSEKVDDKMIIRLSADYNEINLINRLIIALNGKCQGFFITWNFYSFFR
ncbi:hypothetical protein [Methanothermobacter tenebrarum]|uniref:Uncharacterized protein n=1 Tax=Methanothermobacter tenebrarum TaxID=680118 RepID=A0A328PIY0_9EURY|nr:hypothetical protein [Methanothermobacter tenebrarum]NPV64938.1 hypothetical protein [Methanobacteriaceae archaeon]RAO79374.1 hypothetical protein DPC56_03430 [Methanothermobacter tenebrarum]